MDSNEPSRQPVLDVLRRAGAVHSRQRAMLLAARSAVWLVIAIPVLMLADVLFHFSDALRLAGAIGVVLAVLAVIAVAVGTACFVRPPVLRVARLLESANPALGSRLVNFLQLDADARREEAAPLTRELARRAVDDAGKSLDLPSLPPLARVKDLPRRARHAVAAAGILAVLSIFGGHHVRQEWLRFLDPFGDHPPFSLTRLELLKPAGGDAVLYGGYFTVEVRASGHQPREVFLTARPQQDGDAAPLTLPMSARGDGTFVARLENIRHPLELVAHTADEGSRSKRGVLGVILTPQIGPAMLRITPPEYTGQKPRELSYRFTALQVLEGSKVGFELRSNRPLGTGKVMIETGAGDPVSLPLSPAAEGPGDVGKVDLTADKSGRLTFFLVDESGNAAAETPTSTLTVTRDLPPAIAITLPERDALVVEGLTIPVTLDATDDYGLRSVRLHIGINDKFLPLEPVTFDAPDVRRHRIEQALDLAKLGAKAGDRITLFAEAVDTRPDPQLTRTSTRRMEVITEEDYNDRLREKVDVAMIAGKYEQLLKRFEDQIAEQKRIEDELAALREAPGGEKSLEGFSKAFSEQSQLNQRLEQMADDMEDFGRDKPVYDFEKELQEKLKEQAQAIRESVEKNRAEGEKALENGPPPPEPPGVGMMEEFEKAGREQRERLQGGSDKANEEIREPLEELAQLHELMKDFNRFQQLTEEQRELAEQTKAYQDKPQLNAEDRLAMREMGARQRELAPKLDQLARKLRHDAEAAEEKLPEAATSARQLADQMDAADMQGLARQAAQSMLDSKAVDSHAQATRLHEEMERLFEEAGEQGEQGLAQGLDRALRLQRGMKPGDSLRQMGLSKNFRPLPGEGESGAGTGGFMADSMMNGEPMMLGGESLLDGPIANSISGQGDQGGPGMPGAPTARLDQPDASAVDQQTARRTDTPGSSTLLLEYESIADAYFRRLTTKP